jgi:peptidoglycan/LPS O-acetylase OafA/YrhL
MGKNRLASIQVLRGIAASMVVFHHVSDAIYRVWPNGLWVFSSVNLIKTGAAGVDIFFLISGFIMIYVSPPYRAHEKPASDFLIRRVIRIYPLYAIVTLLTIGYAVAHLYVKPADGFPYSVGQIAAAFAFMPHFNPESGWVQPIVKQGWSLYYEMFFYVCFAGVLAWSNRYLLLSLIAIFSVVLLAANLLGSPDNAIAVVFSDPIMIEFLFGCAIGILYKRGLFNGRFVLPWLVGSLLLLALGSAFGFPDSNLRCLSWGIPAAGILITFLKLDLSEMTWPRPLTLLGDASYSVYLTHSLVFYHTLNLILKRGAASVPGDALIAGLTPVIVALGVAFYLAIEGPINRRLMAEYLREPQAR